MMYIGKTISKYISFLLIAYIINLLISLVRTPLIARYLGAKGYGIYSFVIAFVSMFTPLAHGGLLKVTERRFSCASEDKGVLASNVFSVGFLLSLLALGLVILLANILNNSQDITSLVIIAGVAFIIIGIPSALIESMLRGNIKMDIVSYFNVGQTILFLSAVLLVIRYELGIYGIIIGFLISQLTVLFGYTIYFRKYFNFKIRINWNPAYWKRLLKESYPFGLVAVLSLVHNKIDVTMLLVMRSSEEVGWYSVGYRLNEVFIMLAFVISRALFPFLVRLQKSDRARFENMYQKMTKYFLVLGFLISILSTILAKEIITILFGAQYQQSIICFKILVWMVPIMYLVNFLYQTLYSIDMERASMIIYGSCALLNIFCNLLLIPAYGYIGAAVATIISCFLCMLLHLSVASKNVCKPRLKNILSPVLSCAAVLAVIYLGEYNLMINLILSCFVFGLALILFKAINKDDYLLVRRIIG